MSIGEITRELNRRKIALKKLEVRRSKLQRELDAVNAEIAGLTGEGAPVKSVGRPRGSGVGVKRPRNKGSLVDAIAEVLSKDKPMGVEEVKDAVLANGYKTNSGNFKTIVNQTLVKEKRFVSKSRGQYVLGK